MDNNKTLGFKGDETVKYVDVVSGSVGLTMVVKIQGGIAAKIDKPMLIFTNAGSTYPIRGTPDTVEWVTYRTSPKGFMNGTILAQYLNSGIFKRDRFGRHQFIFCDNAPSHKETEEVQHALERINASILFLPKNATDLVQPCDSFVIAKIKEVWTRKWEEQKMRMIQNNEWSASSGKLPNPGKTFFLQLAADTIQEVNAVKDLQGIGFGRKAMIRCGLSLNTDGVWSKNQLSAELQEVIKKYWVNFDGEPPSVSQECDEED
ncbi:hypothetical protein RCL1_008149 [Eukaryota sp. TZLM3-RCL]